MSLDFGVLGPLQVSVDRQPVPLGTPKQRAVLALLLINRNRTVPRDSIIDGIWDDSAHADATHNLHVYVANLRRKLEPSPSRPRYLLTEAGMGYRFCPGAQSRSPAAGCSS